MSEAIEGVIVDSATDNTVHVLEHGKYAGLEVKIRQSSPDFLMKMQKVFGAVKMPQRPKYQARTLTGRMEEHYMDETAAKQTPGGEKQWKEYKELLVEAKTQQNDRVGLAIMYYGVDFVPPETGWEDEQSFLGIEVPQIPEQKKAHFLNSELDPEDMAAIISKVMRSAGMDEGLVKEAEDSFRSAIRPESESA